MVETVDLPLSRVRLRALAWGEPGQPLAVLLHGFPDTAHTWRHLGPALATEGYRVVAPFSRGYAPSDVPADGRGDIGALMHDLVDVHRCLGGGPDAVLVGHDWGAEAANGLAAHPDSPYARVVSLAVPPAPAFYSRATLRLLPRQALRSWYIAYNLLPRLPEATCAGLVERLWRRWSPAYDAGEDLTHVRHALADQPHRAAAFAYYRHAASPRRTPSPYRHWQAALGRWPRVPFLYLHGADDGCIGAGFADHVARGLPPGSQVRVIRAAGHFVHLERPGEVNARIVDFLRRDRLPG